MVPRGEELDLIVGLHTYKYNTVDFENSSRDVTNVCQLDIVIRTTRLVMSTIFIATSVNW